ncbi:MAG: prefoldin subunit alpha [Methanospirillaceae archaeon]|nr:prefoldin subunit alpha [Methanospirillaceae archaeon]
MSSVDPREVQSLQMYLQEYSQQAEMVSRQLAIMEEGIREGNGAIESLRMIHESDGGIVLLPLGGGVNTRVRVENPDHYLVNIGADVVVSKTKEDSVSFLQERITEMNASYKNLSEALGRLQSQIRDISTRLDYLYKQSQEEQGRRQGVSTGVSQKIR